MIFAETWEVYASSPLSEDKTLKIGGKGRQKERKSGMTKVGNVI